MDFSPWSLQLGVNINDIDITQFKNKEIINKVQNKVKYDTIVNSEFKINHENDNHLAQQVYLSGNAQITFAKQIYRRYTDFNMTNSCIDKQNIDGLVYEKEFDNVNNIMALFIKIDGYDSVDDVYDLIENVNINISGVEFLNLSGGGIKAIYNSLKPNMDKSNGLAILLHYSVPIPVFVLFNKNMKIKIKFKKNINSEVSIGIRYMVMKSQAEIGKFVQVGHEYLFRNSVEYKIDVTQNQKKVFKFPNDYLAEFVYFIMPNQTCDMKGVMTSGNDTYVIDRYHGKDCVKLLYDFNLSNNVYMCTSNIGSGTNFQPNGNIVLKKTDKIEITANYSGKLIIVICYFNILRIMNGSMGFAYNNDSILSTDEMQETIGNVEHEISIKSTTNKISSYAVAITAQQDAINRPKYY